MTKQARTPRARRTLAVITSPSLEAASDATANASQGSKANPEAEADEKREATKTNSAVLKLGKEAFALLAKSAEYGGKATGISHIALYTAMHEMSFAPGESPADFPMIGWTKVQGKWAFSTSETFNKKRDKVRHFFMTHIYGLKEVKGKDKEGNEDPSKNHYLLPDGTDIARVARYSSVIFSGCRVVRGIMHYEQAVKEAAKLGKDERANHKEFPGVPAEKALGPVLQINAEGNPEVRADYATSLTRKNKEGKQVRTDDCNEVRNAITNMGKDPTALFVQYIPFGDYKVDYVKRSGIANNHLVKLGIQWGNIPVATRNTSDKDNAVTVAMQEMKDTPWVLFDALGNIMRDKADATYTAENKVKFIDAAKGMVNEAPSFFLIAMEKALGSLDDNTDIVETQWAEKTTFDKLIQLGSMIDTVVDMINVANKAKAEAIAQKRIAANG